MSALAVWMYGERIGELAPERGRLVFAYAPGVVASRGGRPVLSVGMPARPRPYRGGAVRAFFDGLLPEGEARRMIAYDLGLDGDDVFALLVALGRDSAGALVIAPASEAPPEAGTPEPVDDRGIAERLRRLHVEPLGVDERVRLSLAGVQEKLLLARADDRWCLPVDGAPSTHILKRQHALLPDTVANEGFCMRLAAHAGLPVAAVSAIAFDGVEVLCVERFDRIRGSGGGEVARVHQEDLCQALGLPPQRKYEEAGGPSLRDAALVLDRWSVDPGAREQLLDLTVLNVAIGNADAHGKNVSLLHLPSGRIELAPAYDLMSTTHYPQASVTPGMLIGGVRDITAVTLPDLVREAAGWGLSAETARERALSLLGRLPEAAERAAAEIAPPPGLADAVRRRCGDLAASA